MRGPTWDRAVSNYFKLCSSASKTLECAKNTVMDLDVSFLLDLLTAVSASEEVGWAGVGCEDHHHPVVHCLLHLQQKCDSEELGDAGKLIQNRRLHRRHLKNLTSDCSVTDMTV